MILFINGCTRKNSRTLRLAKYLLSKLDGEKKELNLFDENIKSMNKERLEFRDRAIAAKEFSDQMFKYAKEFAEADTIVMAAPYWDLSFPSVIKTYIENITVSGLTFYYTDKGYPQGLCKGKKFYYVTTSGGFIQNFNFGFDYIKAMVTLMYGIPEAVQIKAEGLDILGTDIEGKLSAAEKEIDRLV